jgi:hypothetical protein
MAPFNKNVPVLSIGSAPEPVVDGFLFNPNLLYQPNRYLPLALQKLMPYRGIGYQPRLFTAPVDARVAIGAGLTVDTQLRMVPGSVIVGTRFAVLTLDVPASNFMYLIRDSNTQRSFADGKSRYINCASLVPNGAAGSALCLFSDPYKVGGGVITVSLANTNPTTDIQCQFLVYVMEPVQSVTTIDAGSIMLPYPAPLVVPGVKK